jgi:hypothetical protein
MRDSIKEKLTLAVTLWAFFALHAVFMAESYSI